MNEEELKSITEHFKYCIKNNVIRDEEYVLMGMEKILNLIEKQQKEIENSISKDKIRDKIKIIECYSKIAKEEIEERIVIADTSSLNYGRKQAHDADLYHLKELLGEEYEK